MNTFEYRLIINEKPYSIYLDSSKDEWKKIIINNSVVLEEKFTLALNKNAYIIYYVICIDGHEVVLSVDDSPLEHKYDIFLDGISLLTEKALDSDYTIAKENISKGFKKFCKDNWKSLLIASIGSFSVSVVAMFALGTWGFEKWYFRILLALLAIPVTLPIFIIAEWIHNKNIIKKYKNCFRPSINFK